MLTSCTSDRLNLVFGSLLPNKCGIFLNTAQTLRMLNNFISIPISFINSNSRVFLSLIRGTIPLQLLKRYGDVRSTDGTLRFYPASHKAGPQKTILVGAEKFAFLAGSQACSLRSQQEMGKVHNVFGRSGPVVYMKNTLVTHRRLRYVLFRVQVLETWPWAASSVGCIVFVSRE
jgi:hypothetical protein